MTALSASDHRPALEPSSLPITRRLRAVASAAPATPAHDNFRRLTTRALAFSASVLITPFALNNLFQQRWALGSLSILIVASLITAAWSIQRGQRWADHVHWVLAPAILAFLAVSISEQGLIGVLWSFPAVLAFAAMLPERAAWAMNGLALLLIASLTYQVAAPELWPRIIASLLGVSVFAGLFVRVIERQRSALLRMAHTDPLTGLGNRSQMRQQLQQQRAQADRCGQSLSLMMLDIDYFKQINDRWGHARGDAVLRAVARCLREHSRSSDLAYRIGGEEFLLALPGCGHAAAIARAEVLRNAIAALDLLPLRPVTVSAGVAEWSPEENTEDAIRRADQLLYRAKQAGRNRVIG